MTVIHTALAGGDSDTAVLATTSDLLRDLTGRREPFDRLGSHGGDKIEVLVIVQHDQTVKFRACSEDEVGGTGCSVSSGTDHQPLHLQRPVDHSIVQSDPRHGVKITAVSRKLQRGSRSDQDLDHADTGDRERSRHQSRRPSRRHTGITKAHPCRLIDQVRRHSSVPCRQNRSTVIGLQPTNPADEPFTSCPLNDTA